MLRNVEPLSLGFIGGGLSSAIGKTHFNAARLDGRWRLDAGVFSRNADVNRQTARDWNVSEDRLHSCWEEFIEKEVGKLDAVAVLTPTPDHVEKVCALLDAGVPVICEKALASSVEEAERILRHYNSDRHFLAVTFNYSGYPMMRELRHRVMGGELGKIQHLRLEMPQETFLRRVSGKAVAPQAWRLVDGAIPTICLDLGVHLHHLAHFATGLEPNRVFGRFSSYSEFRGITDNADILLDYADGVTASLSFSKTELGSRNGLKIRIYGDKGGAEWVQMQPEDLSLAFADGSRLLLDRGGPCHVAGLPRYTRMKAGHPAGFVEAFANLYVDIADSLMAFKRGDKEGANPYVFGLDHAVFGLRLFQAAAESSRAESWKPILASKSKGGKTLQAVLSR